MKSRTNILHQVINICAEFSAVFILLLSSSGYSQENETLLYRVVAVQDSGTQVSISNYLTVRYPFQVYVPNAFTPDGDGLNNVFQVKGESISTFEITIFDRAGHLVFKSNSVYDGWDGTLNGTKSPAGAYGYDVSAESDELGKFQKTGIVIIAYSN
jgi:gliding motility-associated-like protein